MDTLKPCPFCGSAGNLGVGLFGERFIRCTNEGCQGGLGPSCWQGTNEQAIQAWNQRASEWVSVEDKLPVYGTEVLIRGLGEKDKHYMFEFATRKESINSFIWEGRDCSEIWLKVIDWMPLPEAPHED